MRSARLGSECRRAAGRRAPRRRRRRWPRSRDRAIPTESPSGGRPPRAAAPQPPEHHEDEDVGPDEQHDEPRDDHREAAADTGREDRGIEVPRRGSRLERCEEERREPDSDGRVPSEERDRDADEADVRPLDRRDVDAVLPAEDVERPREPGEQPGDRHREEVVARDVDPAVPRRFRVVPHRPNLVAERRPVEDERVDDERRARDEEPDVQALQERVPPERVQVRLVGNVRRRRNRTCAAGRLQRPADVEQVRPDPDDDPVEHDRRDHLVGADRPLQQAGQARERCSREHRAQDRDDDQQEAGQVDDLRKLRRDQYGRDRTREVLAVAADVEEAAPERERDGEARQHERRPEQQRLLEVRRGLRGDVVGVPREPDAPVAEGQADRVAPDVEEPVQPRAAEDRAVRLERVADASRRQQHDDAADEKREREREQRREQPLCLLQEAVARYEASRLRLAGRLARELLDVLGQAAASLRPPVIAMPSSSSVTVGGYSPTISPSNRTRMRSESERISSSSSETSRMALPSSRSSISLRCTTSIAPTSRPRVGWAAISTFGSRSISRARITFCWFPPDSAPAGVSGPPPRTSNSVISVRAFSTSRFGYSQPKRAFGALRKSWSATFSAIENS